MEDVVGAPPTDADLVAASLHDPQRFAVLSDRHARAVHRYVASRVSITGSVIMGYDPGQVTDGAHVTVVTGTQFAVNAPATASAAGGSTTAGPPTISTATPSASIASPSTASSKLQPWDPRSCPAGSTPTAPVPNRT
jgi:hypothetical protein